MNTAFTRLIWKEYRAQRSLWLLLLFAASLTHVMLRSGGAPWTVSLGLTSVFSICFLVAGLAIAFAGEVDEGTVGLLRMLPCRTKTLISAKLTALFGGCVLLVAATLVMVGAFELFAQFFPRHFGGPTSPVEWSFEDALVIGVSVGLFCSASLFASMMSRRVIFAVGMAAALITAFFFIVTLMTTRDNHIRTVLGASAVGFALISVVLLCVSLFVLARPWHLGTLPPQRSVADALHLRFRTDRRLTLFSGMWRKWLQRVASQPMSQRRVFSTLFWRECRSAIPFAITWFVMAIVVCAGRFWIVEYPWPLVFLFVFVHECGQRTMREDQRTGAISFMANIGIAPRQVYSSKIFCWLGLAIIGTALLIFADSLVPMHAAVPKRPASELRIVGLIDLLRVPNGERLGIPESPATVADLWLQAGVCLSIFLGLFGIGQLTAFWIQRQVLAFAASFVLVMTAGCFLLTLIVGNDWPIWIAVVPIPFCLLFATRTTARQWIDRKITWRLRFRQAAWIVVPFVCFPTFAGYVWFNQPAEARNALVRNSHWAQWQDRFDMFEPAVVAQLNELKTFAELPKTTWNKLDNSDGAKCWYEFFAAVEKLPEPGLLIVDGTLAPEYRQPYVLLSHCQQPSITFQAVRELLRPFDAILEKTDAFPMLPVTWTAPWSGTPAPTVTAILLEDARLLEAAGDISGAVQQMVRAIRLCRSLAIQTSSWDSRAQCLDAKRVALGRLRLLLGTADLASVDLEELFKVLQSERAYRQHEGKSFPQWHDIGPMLRRRTLFYTAAVDAPENFFDALRKLPIAARGFDPIYSAGQKDAHIVLTLGPIFAVRAITVMEFSEALLLEKYQAMPTLERGQFRGPDQTENLERLRRFVATSEFPELQKDLGILESKYFRFGLYAVDVDTVASERATLLTIRLHQYRLKNGVFPDTLLELLDDNRTNYLIYEEPWSGSPFIYVKQTSGHYVQLGYQQNRTLLTGPAVMASPDAWLSNIRSPILKLTPEGITDVYELPANMVVFVGSQDPVDWRLKEFAIAEKLVP